MSVWKRNAVVVAIVLFVGAAVYLNWSYGREAAANNGGTDSDGSGKLLGQAALVNGKEDGKQGEDGQTGAQPSADPSAKPSASGEQTGYFASARLNRQQARDSALQLLQQAAADAGAQQDIIDEANASIQAMAALTMSEANVENLITAKGYGDCVCFINDNSASVVVSSTENGLSENDVTKIMEIVKKETGLTADKITVIENEP
ncbi:MAG: SpoIIIAH-like family protein [Oscillospiraceae bacterium]|jgi:stage III sporulation protein AH|nr:SpoIIIAH-like family protein [Oscillospiraceae bacterium]MCI9551618.1 SpoIIIAH-like family protein [Oscillospiraceae bacterium]